MADYFSSYSQRGGYSGGDTAADATYTQPSNTANNANPHGQNSLPSNSAPSWHANSHTPNLTSERDNTGNILNPSIWAPGVESTLKGVASVAKANPDAVLNMGAKWTQDIISEGTARMIPGLNQFMSTLRVYFAVDNFYVQKKMRKVLFSFLFKDRGK